MFNNPANDPRLGRWIVARLRPEGVAYLAQRGVPVRLEAANVSAAPRLTTSPGDGGSVALPLIGGGGLLAGMIGITLVIMVRWRKLPMKSG